MKRLAFALVACLLVQAGGAPPAHANIWRWIDELSGPGPFKGIAPEFRVKCWGATPLPDDAPKDERVERIAGVFTAKLPCPTPPEPGTYYEFSLNLQVGILWSRDNPIEYAQDLPASQKKVMLFPVESVLYWQPALGFEMGAGGGLFIFQNSRLFATQYVPVIDLFRLDVRPFDMVFHPKKNNLTRKLLRTLTFRYGIVFIPQKLDATYFGGSPGDPFTPRRELLRSYEVVVDIEPLLRKTVKMPTASQPRSPVK